MISGMHGNPNFSGDALGKAIQSLEEDFGLAIAKLYGYSEEDDVGSLSDNPFFASMKLPEITTDVKTFKEKGLPFEIEIDSGV